MISSQYVILQYGNVITGEYLNIAVFAFDDDESRPKVYSKFLENWTRVNAAFGMKDGDKDIIFESILNEHLKKIDTRKELLECMEASNSPFSSLLFTEPRISSTPAETLVEEMAKIFLIE